MTVPRFASHVIYATTAVLLLALPGRGTAQELLPSVDFRINPAFDGEFWPGDFDGDGATDLAVRDQASGVVTIALAGDNIPSSTEGFPRTAADVNRDGFEDVLAETGSGVVVLPGNGDGTLGAPRTVLDVDPTFVRVADMDGDGHRDVVIGEEGESLHIVPGNGDFTFRPAVTMTTGTWPHGVTVADFNGDDRPDVAVANRYDIRLVIFRNDGGLLFTRSDIVVDHPSTDVTARDLNGDGHVDLAATVRESADGDFGFDFGAVYVFPGNGDGTFGERQEIPTLNGPVSLALGDFTHDGRLDIATTNGPQFRADNSCGQEFGAESLSILPGNDDGTFGPPTSFELGRDLSLDSIGMLNTSDLDADGFPDLLVGFGSILLTAAPRANRPPLVDAGDDRVIRNSGQISVVGEASDPDGHYLTYAWSDGGAGGSFYAPVLGTCYEPPPGSGRFTITLTADDGHGGVGSDSFNLSAPVEDGPDVFGQNIGAVSAEGSVVYEDGVYTVRGSGADVWGTADEFYWVHQSASGDFDFTAHVTSVQHVNRWTKAGLMVRASDDPGSAHASLFATPSTEKGVAFQRRRAPGGTSVHTAGPAVAPPVWLRLTRRGATITAWYRKTTDDPWTEIGSDSIPLPERVRVGLAVSSHIDGTLAAATFESVAVTRGTPQGWSKQDVGAVAVPGSLTVDSGGFTVEGSGADIWGTADEFTWAVRELSGDFEISTQVTSVENVNRWTKAGLMIRASDDASSSHASLFATPTTEKGLAFQRRRTNGATSVHTGGPPIAPPVWLRLSRRGETVTASYRRTFSDEWTEIGSDIVALPSTVLVGLAVSSHVDGTLATATFSGPGIGGGVPTLPEGWSNRDVGSVGAAGSAAHDEGTFTIEGSGADIWGTADEFHFASRTWNLADGAVEVIARVAAVENVDRWTKAGIMVRHTLDAGSPHAMLIVTPTTEKGVAFQRRPERGGTSVHTAGPVVTAPIWLRLVAQGSDVRAYYRLAETDSWTFIGEDTLDPAAGEWEVGLVVSSHEHGTLATAEFDSVTVRALSGT